MTTHTFRGWNRAAFGALLLILAGACSDVPSAPIRHVPIPQLPNPFAPRAADVPMLDAGLPALLPGESVRRRSMRGADGRMMQVESLIGRNGRPRATLVRRDGAVLIRVDNDWSAAAGWDDVVQRVTVRGADGRIRTFSSRDISPAERAAAREKVRLDAVGASMPATAGRTRALMEESGVCDAQVKAADIATWQYTVAGAAVLAVSLTGNPLAVMAAASAYLAAYANYESKQADLDKCVAAAGKPPTVDEY
jgi:hypothetical protein